MQVDGWKLIVGAERQNGWFGWFSPNVSNPINRTSPVITAPACEQRPCLFNLNTSITEHEDVARHQPDVVQRLLARFRELTHEYHPPQRNPSPDLDGYCAAIKLNGGFVGPWQEVANEE